MPDLATFFVHNEKMYKIKKFYLQLCCKYVMLNKLFSAKHKQGGASVMAKCEFCDKGVSFGIQVSHSHRRSNRTWKPNVKRVKAIVDGSPKHVYACTRCLRSGKVTRAV